MSEERTIKVGPEGELSGLEVIGIHGFLDDRMTPARRLPVFRSSDGRLARLNPEDVAARRLEIHIEVGPPITDSGPLPGDGTRVGPWPATLARVLVAMGARERERVDELLPYVSRDDVRDVLRWFGGRSTAAPPPYTAAIDGGVVWYCPTEDAVDVWRSIERVAETELKRVKNEKGKLRAASWWLSRASLSDRTMFLACAGLKRAEVDDWRHILARGTPRLSAEERNRGMAEADRELAKVPGTAWQTREKARRRNMSEGQKKSAA